MANKYGQTPNLKSSKAVGKGEIQNVKQNLNKTSGQGMTAGATPNLTDSNSVGNQEMQNVKNNVRKSGNKNNKNSFS